MAQSKAPKTPKTPKTPKNSKASKEAVDYTVKKQELLEKAKKDGSISQRDIFDVIPEGVENTEILDALYTELADASIEITLTTEPDPANFTNDWAAEEEPEEEEDTSKAIYVDDDVAEERFLRLGERSVGDDVLAVTGTDRRGGRLRIEAVRGDEHAGAGELAHHVTP